MIEIQQATDGSWAVVFNGSDGLHHDFFSTQADALEFCRVYYGVQL